MTGQRNSHGLARTLKRTALFIGTALLCASLASGAVADGGVTYTYDALGRVITATYANGTVVTFSYDAAGNRTALVVGCGHSTWGAGSSSPLIWNQSCWG